MSAFEVEEMTVANHDISFRIEGPKGAELGPSLLKKLQGMDSRSLEEFVNE